MDVLSDREIDEGLQELQDWRRDGITITAEFRCKDFSAAIGFVVGIAMAAEKADHHPDIDIRWDTVTLRLSTHSSGGVTRRDLELASHISVLSTSYR